MLNLATEETMKQGNKHLLLGVRPDDKVEIKFYQKNNFKFITPKELENYGFELVYNYPLVMHKALS